MLPKYVNKGKYAVNTGMFKAKYVYEGNYVNTGIFEPKCVNKGKYVKKIGISKAKYDKNKIC